MPPRAKVYEALSAVADGRVETIGATSATVTSSSLDKKYQLEWSPDFTSISSNDNASFYQGYLGYPIIAVLLALGRVPYDPHVASLLAGVPWKKLNTKHKRNYDKAIEEVLAGLPGAQSDRDAIESQVTSIFDALPSLQLQRGSTYRTPPAGK